ncbi:hypothetical protein M9458_008618, partial [Cirrhinus mrigala]
FLTPSDGHDRCLTCLGREHSEMAFVDGSCPHCERMSMAALRLPSAPSRPGLLGSTSSAATLVRKKGNLTITVRNALTGQAPRKSDLSRRPADFPEESTSSSRGEPCISFGAPEEDRMSIVASEEELTPDEAEESAEQLPRLFGDTFSAVQKQTEAIKHILPRRDLHLLVAEGAPPAASTPAPPPPPK